LKALAVFCFDLDQVSDRIEVLAFTAREIRREVIQVLIRVVPELRARSLLEQVVFGAAARDFERGRNALHRPKIRGECQDLRAGSVVSLPQCGAEAASGQRAASGHKSEYACQYDDSRKTLQGVLQGL
jgi:hypothetical protein